MGLQVNLIIVSAITVELVQFCGCHVYNCLSHLKGIRSNPLDMLILEFQVYVYIVSVCVICLASWSQSEMEELCHLLVTLVTAAAQLMNEFLMQPDSSTSHRI